MRRNLEKWLEINSPHVARKMNCEGSKGELFLWGTQLDIDNYGKARIVPGATRT